MPLEIINKPKTKPDHISHLPVLTPLKVWQILPCSNSAREQWIQENIQIGDLVVGIKDAHTYNVRMLLCKTGMLLEPSIVDFLLLVHAYEVQAIYICSDNTPAPVI